MVASRNKVGAPFQHAESLLAALAAVKSMAGLPYRHLQGMPVETLGDLDTPCYTTIYRRFQALGVKRNGCVFYRHGRWDSAGPPRGRLHRPKAAQPGGVDQAQMEGPERIRQAPRDGGRGHEEETGRCSFRCLTRPRRLRHGQVRRRIPPPGRQMQDAACTGMALTLPEATLPHAGIVAWIHASSSG